MSARGKYPPGVDGRVAQHAKLVERNARLVSALKSERTTEDIAHDFKLTTNTVSTLGNQLCPRVMAERRARFIHNRKHDRNAQIVQALKSPRSLRDIGEEFGIAESRVHAIGMRYCPEIMATRTADRIPAAELHRERDAKIVAALKTDATQTVIAERFGLAPVMVWKVGWRDCPEVMAARKNNRWKKDTAA